MFDISGNDISTAENSQVNNSNMMNRSNITSESLIKSSSVLAGMSHEMRTHMNSIVAFSFLLKENSGDDSEREEFSNHIFNSCDQLMGLFDSFLDSALLETGDSKVELKSYNINNFLDDLLNDFRDTLNKDCHKDIELVTEIQYSKSTEVMIDRKRIFRVIRCLFQNSVKNTRAGYIKIGYYLHEEKIVFYVLDSGKDFLKYREFLQTDDLNKTLKNQEDTSTAINLSLARKLIQILGGSIWAESNGIAGAGVYFSIPVKVKIIPGQSLKKFNKTRIEI